MTNSVNDWAKNKAHATYHAYIIHGGAEEKIYQALIEAEKLGYIFAMNERARLEDLLIKCRDRLDSCSESDELYIQVNNILNGEEAVDELPT